MQKVLHSISAVVFTLLANVLAMGGPAADSDRAAEEIVRQSGVRGGLVAHVPCGGGELTAALRADGRYLVHGLDGDVENLAKARAFIESKGIYGDVSVRQWPGGKLPYSDSLVNLLVSDGGDGAPDMGEIMRVLAPLGVAYVKQNGSWEKTVKPWPKEIDEWTHYLHGPDNNAVSQDLLAGMPRSMQWVSGPRWGRSHEELASMSAAVSTNGRVFYIVDEAPLASVRFAPDWKIVARDAFSGVLLWKRPILVWTDHLRHFRSGPLHLSRRLVAKGDRVYVTLGLDMPVTTLDAATGKTLRTFKETEQTEEILFKDGTLYLVVGASEVKASGGGLFRRGEPPPSKDRWIVAVDAETGRELWRQDSPKSDFVLPLTLTVRGQHVLFQSTKNLVCLDAKSGGEIWKTPNPSVAMRYGWSAPTLVAQDEVVLLADRDPQAKGEKTATGADDIEWGVDGWNVASIARNPKMMLKLRAYSMRDGSELWSCDVGEGYNSPADVFVINGLVWTGREFSEGRDLKTGEVLRTISTKGDPLGMVHHRCYRNKASSRFIFTGKSGIEIIDLEKGWLANNSWVRGTCQYGIMPANGYLYAPPDACACFPKVRVPGFNALSAERPVANEAAAERLEKGPAYGGSLGKIETRSDEWLMYRHDAARSGATSAKIGTALSEKWSVEIGDGLTQPIVVGGRVVVAETNAHTLRAFDLESGKALWSFTAGGRIDSAPTAYGELLFFGSADGRVYCLRASDGQKVWSFLAAAEDRLIVAYGQLESAWPAHGSVVIQNGELYCTAGRSSYLDGGIRLYRLDPVTGKQLSRTFVTHLDPVTGKQTAKEGKAAGLGFDMEGTASDILTGDGEAVYLKHLGFDSLGKAIADPKPHLFSITGFLGEEWFVRSFWLHGTETGAGYGGWAKVGNLVPAGRILSFDGKNAYGYGRIQYTGAKAGHRINTYHLFAMPKSLQNPLPPAGSLRKSNPERTTQAVKKTYYWANPSPISVRALTLASDRLVLAGVPDVGVKTQGEPLAFENEKEAREAYTGKNGGLLRVVSTADGSKLTELALEAPPVMDGMAVVDGKVLMSLRNGRLICMQSTE